MKSELVTPAHLARKAIVYIRQSTPAQVVSNQESLWLQYGLRQRARELGWHVADIDVIDADLGVSGASAAQRRGFQELVARVSLSEVGLILSADVTRLARNCSDWYPLLDICGLRGCLIADRDGVYDPGTPNGRLLLGLKGTISELELHTIRSRLTAGLLAKAARGELALTLPIGLTRTPGNIVVKDPDLEVQERLALVFASFLRLRTRSQGDAHAQLQEPGSATAGPARRVALDACNRGCSDDDPEEPGLCRCVRLWPQAHGRQAEPQRRAHVGLQNDRGVAHRCEGLLSCLHRLV